MAEDSSVSEIINEYFADMLEDIQDIKEVRKRRGEKTVSFDEILTDLDITYNDLRG